MALMAGGQPPLETGQPINLASTSEFPLLNSQNSEILKGGDPKPALMRDLMQKSTKVDPIEVKPITFINGEDITKNSENSKVEEMQKQTQREPNTQKVAADPKPETKRQNYNHRNNYKYPIKILTSENVVENVPNWNPKKDQKFTDVEKKGETEEKE
ncbi:hypothetical protein RND71_012225 [Anisodus tanguticus]|uniref:Uncharacterized protein n=1 Tax=Anisodus tanguticus TaxID=243964 RepID=A0AAE1SFG4_9SOLA|nr:hypothetical protein RND71_012225 [Anisodus tanguticus]